MDKLRVSRQRTDNIGCTEVFSLNDLAQKIKKAASLVLSTHKHCDGDGIGAELALYHALRKSGKTVRILNVDKAPKKYRYLDGFKEIQTFESAHKPLQKTDLALVFDTNDKRRLETLYEALEQHCREIIFIDHHPILLQGPSPTTGSFIDENAASTGEIVYNLVRQLRIPFDRQIAQALYTSVAFDTQLFRYIRNSPHSHAIAAELLTHQIDSENIHRHLFGDQTINKISFLSMVLAKIEYFGDGRLALLKVSKQELKNHGVGEDETRDVIDFIMNIDSLEIAVLFREDSPKDFKISLRSKGRIDVLPAAEAIGGGGHPYSAGALITGSYEDFRKKLVSGLLSRIKAAS